MVSFFIRSPLRWSRELSKTSNSVKASSVDRAAHSRDTATNGMQRTAFQESHQSKVADVVFEWVPEEPVVSLKSGLLYEKRLIEQEIEEHGVCPVSKEPLTVDDLIAIKVDKTAKPRPSTATSIPGLLNIFHDEWDALMLECYSLRQSLSNARQELSHSLYQHDAACRVIARLVKERDAARASLTDLQSSKRDTPEDVEMDEHPVKKMHVGMTEEISEFIRLASDKAAEERQDFKISEEVATPEMLRDYHLLTRQPLHATKQGGILSLAFHKSMKTIIATGGQDCTVQIFDTSSQRILASIEEHFKSITDLDWMGDAFLLSSSSDKSVRLWLHEDDDWEMKCGLHLRDHEAEVVSVSCAQNGRFVVSASKDGTLALIDLEQGKCIEKIVSPQVETYTCGKFHPDGRLLASGTETGDIHLWDISQQRIIKTFSAEGSAMDISFHENGRQLATATGDTVTVWDLGTMSTLRTLQPYEGGEVSCVRYDGDGRYLGIGGLDLQIYDTVADFDPVVSYGEMPGRVYCLSFGDGCQSIASGSVDHNLRLFGHD